jgi:hypothetical protein
MLTALMKGLWCWLYVVNIPFQARSPESARSISPGLPHVHIHVRSFVDASCEALSCAYCTSQLALV